MSPEFRPRDLTRTSAMGDLAPPFPFTHRSSARLTEVIDHDGRHLVQFLS